MKKTLFIILTIINLTTCEEKPTADFYGFSEENKKLLLTGLVNNTTFTNSTYGTVTESSLNIEFKKCSQGETYDSATNNCLATAFKLSYCNSASNLCNTTSIPFTLNDPGNTTISEAFDSCNKERTGNFSDWRVTNAVELLKLTAGGRNALLVWFPGTREDNYWSANGNENDTSGLTAKAVSFSRSDFGQINLTAKDTRLYVRCARNRAIK